MNRFVSLGCVLACLVGLPSWVVSAPSVATSTSLVDAYQQALLSDPVYAKAHADFQSAKENLPIARAAYLTQLSATANYQYQYKRPATKNRVYGFSLTLTQPVFNAVAWAAIRSADAGVKSAAATFSDASQNLIRRTIKAYLGVLQARAALQVQQAKRQAVLEQLNVAREQYKVGLIAITSIYDARSAFDQATVAEIGLQDQLNTAVEQMAELTGHHYAELMDIGAALPLAAPQPNNIDAWTARATAQNYALLAQQYAVMAAHAAIAQQSAAWLPQLGLTGGYTQSYQTDTKQRGAVVAPASRSIGAQYGLAVTVPVLSGGKVVASTRQAEANFASASSAREATYRNVVSQTRQYFLSVNTGQKKVRADQLSVVSAKKALEATQSGYKVGTRTMVDVLNDVSSLYQAQQQLADDQYSFIGNLVDLKYYAGTLCAEDLTAMSQWLSRPVAVRVHVALATTSPKKRAKHVKQHPAHKKTKHLKKSQHKNHRHQAPRSYSVH